MGVLWFVLAILGAIGGLVLLWTWGRRWYQVWQDRIGLRRVPKDWYYEKQDMGVRISQSGLKWQTVRTCRAISLIDDLAGLDIGVRPFDVSSLDYSISPSNLALEPGKGSLGYTRFMVKPERPLRQSDPLEFEFGCDFVKSEYQRDADYLSWCSNRRVDWLCQRVVFMDDLKPAMVRWQIVDSAGKELKGGDLTPDKTTSEYRHEFRNLVPDKTYSISWEY